MPRVARLVVPGYPHHVTQRGIRRQRIFFDAADYLSYLSLIIELKDRAGVDVWAYCLMPNHVHLVAVPQEKLSLAKLFGVAHHRYALRVNSAQGWQGHLWQERYHSSVLDESHLIAAVRYIERNPVRAGLCAQPEDWRWSSVHAHLTSVRDDLVNTAPMGERISNWREYLSEEDIPDVLNSLRAHTRTGRPAGDVQFVNKIEAITGRKLRRRRPGPEPYS